MHMVESTQCIWLIVHSLYAEEYTAHVVGSTQLIWLRVHSSYVEYRVRKF